MIAMLMNRDQQFTVFLPHLYQIKEAIQFYSRAHCFNHGIRLAMENEMDAEVLSLALQSTGNHKVLVDAARYNTHIVEITNCRLISPLQLCRYFEERQMYDKAVLLYHKGGSLAKAIELCFVSQLFDSLGLISK
jgi:intraflagellar transport protein 140